MMMLMVVVVVVVVGVPASRSRRDKVSAGDGRRRGVVEPCGVRAVTQRRGR